jgi:hypothetical protein
LFDRKFDELADLFVGAWKGFVVGMYKLRDTLSKFPQALVPWYGNYCSPAATGKNIDLPGINPYDEGVCRPHDVAWGTKGASRLKADFMFVVKSLFWYPVGLHSFDIAYSGQYGGRPMIGSVHKFFSMQVFAGLATGRVIKKILP